MNTIYPLSFSRIQTFEQCAYRFEGQYITGEFRDAGSDASRYGNRVHEAFEAYCKDDAPLNAETINFQPLLDKLQRAPGDKHYELHMAVRADRSVCEWDDPDCWIRGIADFAVVNGKRGVAGDWKTGKPKDDTFQLMLMACLMFEHFPELDEVLTKYVWIHHPLAPSPTMTYRRSMLNDYWQVFEKKIEVVERAASTGVFAPKPSGLCPWCPRYETCGYAKRRKK